VIRRLGLLAFLPLVASCATSQAAPRPEIAITIDDLPVHAPYPPSITPAQVSAQMIAALKAGSAPAYGFVNAVYLEKHPDTERVLEAWRSAGFVLGNHGWAHRHLSEMTDAEFEDELTKGEPVLGKLGAGTDWRWFRYPFLDEGKDAQQRVASRQILAKHGYRVAAVTAGFSDWQFTEPYARCMAIGDRAAVAELEHIYMDAVRDSIAVNRETAQKLYGRDIPYVLLMHVSAMSAHMMRQVVQAYRDAGFRFVSLREAEQDPAYREYTDLNLAPPPSPGELAARKGVPLPQTKDYSARLTVICPGAPAAPSP
jgi:peptidoglycan/xylan/chitin deacetylase (PgdA/CDA1 family)